MSDADFSAACLALADRLFPTPEREGPLGDVPADAQLLRELLGRYGGARLWLDAYRRALRPFAAAFRKMKAEAAVARSVGHDYPDRDGDTFPVPVAALRKTARVLREDV